MKVVISGASKTTIILIVVIAICAALVGSWLMFGIRQYDHLHARVNQLRKSDPEQALALYPKLFEELDKEKISTDERCNAYYEYGSWIKQHGRIKEAVDCFKKTLEYSRKEWLDTRANTLIELAGCQICLDGKDRPTKADIDALLVAGKIHPPRSNGQDKWFWTSYDEVLGGMYACVGEYDKAMPRLKAAADTYVTEGYEDQAVEVECLIVDALVRQGKYADAARKFVEFSRPIKSDEIRYIWERSYKTALHRAEGRDPDFNDSVLAMLHSKQFEKLDNLESKMLAENKVLASGLWTVDDFYTALDPHKFSSFESDWQAHIALIKEWIAARPQSNTAKIVLAKVLCSYVWKVRGSTADYRMSGDEATEFKKQLEEAISVLQQVQDKPAQWYGPAQRCALGLDWSPERYNEMVEECRKKYPDYFQAVFNKCYWLTARKDAKETEAKQYLDSESKKIAGSSGKLLYGRAAWFLENVAGDGLMHTQLEWSHVKASLQQIIKQYPDSLSARGQLVVMAVHAGDEKTALSAFAGK